MVFSIGLALTCHKPLCPFIIHFHSFIFWFVTENFAYSLDSHLSGKRLHTECPARSFIWSTIQLLLKRCCQLSFELIASGTFPIYPSSSIAYCFFPLYFYYTMNSLLLSCCNIFFPPRKVYFCCNQTALQAHFMMTERIEH